MALMDVMLTGQDEQKMVNILEAMVRHMYSMVEEMSPRKFQKPYIQCSAIFRDPVDKVCYDSPQIKIQIDAF